MEQKSEVLILKNISHEGPGLIASVLEEEKIETEIIDLSKEEPLPPIENYKLLVIMGGPDSVNDFSDKINREKDCIKQAIDLSVPVFGVCLGLQLLADAMGAEVYKNSVEENGFKHNGKQWYRINFTEEGKKDYLFHNIDNNFRVFQLHGETINNTPEITVLGTGKFCRNQIIKVGNLNYAVQFHFELDEDLFLDYVSDAPELHGKDTEKLKADFYEIKEEYVRRGKQLFRNYLKIIDLI